MKKQPKTSSLNRRTFIRGAAVTSAVAGFPAITHSKSPNGKLAIGLIGVGGVAAVMLQPVEMSRWFRSAT